MRLSRPVGTLRAGNGFGLNFNMLAAPPVFAAAFALAAPVYGAPVPSQSSTQSSAVHFSIPPSDLQTALLQLASQADVQVVANAEDTRGLSTKGLSGNFSIQEALTRLLEGSGLQYKLDSAGTITVMHAPAAQMHQSAVQDAPGTASPSHRAASEPENLEEIVVTSQKRVERLQDVPLAVTAISGESLSEAGINDTTRLSNLTPSLTFTEGAQPNNRNFRIRGIGTAVFGQGFEPAVSVVVDGVVLARASQGFTDLADIERVEVLRGPQGTLFG